MNIIRSTQRAAFNVTTGVMGCLISPQNGAVDGTLHLGCGAPSPQLERAAATDSLGGSNSTPKQRPSAIGVSSKNGFATKGLLTDDSGLDQGSLQCTPELESLSEIDSAADEVLENDTRQLIARFLTDFTGISKAPFIESKILSTMKRVVKDILEKHRFAYNGMINRLSLDDRGDNVSFVRRVAESLFSDGTTNWGRVASLVAFGAVVCQHMKEKGRGNCVELVGQEISSYLLSDQRDWLVENNSWDGFVEFFRVADPESTVRNTLTAFAGVAAIGATLALLIR
ncbi:induced myeloid leukemia cell differentiation protein Mcl-1b [Aulostomus maculatus]